MRGRAVNKRTELFVYAILIALAALLSYLLVTDMIQAKSERLDFRKSERYEIPPEEVVSFEPTPLETAIAVYVDRDLFGPLITPLPTPTKKIEPSPTPTIPPLAKGWEIKNILGGRMVHLETGDKKRLPYKEGDTVPRFPTTPDAVGHVIKKIETDRILILRTTDNVAGWLYKDGGVELIDGPLPE